MSTGTLPELRPPQDPWAEAAQGISGEQDGAPRDEALAKRFAEVMSQYAQPEEVSPAEAPVGNLPRSDYINEHTPEEIARRENANMLANFALARTLMDSHPELIQDLSTATENMDTIAFPAVRPDNYRGRHRGGPASYRGRHRR